nr:hypothetical protein [Elizabethkingia sp. ASV34]
MFLCLGSFFSSKNASSSVRLSRPRSKMLLIMARPVSYTHLTLPTTVALCRSRWSPEH